MTDRAFEPANPDPFEQIAKNGSSGVAEQPPDDADDPFAKIARSGGVPVAPGSTAVGAFGRGVERSAAPALFSFPAFGVGAEVGSVLGPWGALAGGVVGAAGGGYLLQKAQDYLLSKAPDSWKEKIGLDDRQEQLDQSEHPYASFLGGLAPYAVTMRPGAIPTTALPENATALQRILAHPATARVFGGAAMGGMELGQEAGQGETPDWTKVAVSTGFGLVFNQPTRLGESLTELGAQPARRLLGRPSPVPAAESAAEPAETPATATVPEAAAATEARPAAPAGIAPTLFHGPTVAQANDLGVMGPGVTEQTFLGSQKRAQTSAMTAHETARSEQALTNETPTLPDIHDVARRMDADLFNRYEDLSAQRNSLQGWIDEVGPAEAPTAVGHLAALDKELEEVTPQVAAAYRRAAEATGAATVEHPAAPSESWGLFPPPEVAETGHVPLAPEAVAGTPAEPAAPATSESVVPQEQPRTIEQQKAFIANDVTTQLTAAGRPPEEAAAAGKLVAARYEARATRLGGKAGSPEELYNREAALIRGRGGATPAPTGAPPTVAPTPAAEGAPLAEQTPASQWSAFLAARQERTHPLSATGGYNDSIGRTGVPLRLPKSQAWTSGNMVDVGFVKDLLITKANPDGTYTLVGKPNAEGISKSYNAKPQQGLSGDRPVNFKEATQHLTVEPEPATIHVGPKAARGPRAVPEERWSLLQFIADKGGIKSDDKNIGDVRSIFGKDQKWIPGFGPLIRPKGLPLDRLWEAAVNAGYIHDEGAVTGRELKTNFNDLLEAMTREEGGDKVYREGVGPKPEREAEPAEVQRDKENRAETEKQYATYLDEIGLKPKDVTADIKSRIIELMERERVDPAVAHERAVMEQDDHAVETQGYPERAEHIPGWDIPDDAGTAPRQGEAIEEGEEATTGEGARTSGNRNREEAWTEYYQRLDRNLIAEREAEGQQNIPGAEHITDAELAKRRANESLKPSVEQKPADEGLFGDEAKQRELFQRKAQTETPEFKRWFGDSKVVDSHGDPLVVFHGTASEFDEFGREHIGKVFGDDKEGFFFTNNVGHGDLSSANDYAKNAGRVSGGDPSVVPAFVSLKNPLIVDDVNRDGFNGRGAVNYLESVLGKTDIIAEAKENGHDGVMVVDRSMRVGPDGQKGPENIVIAFHPAQIKSAIGNRGNFEVGNPKILEQGSLGSIKLREGQRPIITLARDANASTFIHESGHQYLEELFRDAKHDAAPDDLKADAQTIRDWLGIAPKTAPPPKPGMIRYYHGTSRETAEGFTGKTFVSPHYQYARDYHGGPNNVLYFDVPKDEAIRRGIYDDINDYPRSGSIDDGEQRLKSFETNPPIETRAHEKFARGFEQYLREGVAPTKDLAGVFSKFRNWLVGIYSTLKKLGSPINDDVRRVFDRMLATEPQRTVIAPEQAIRPTLADIHQADAAEIPPVQAAAHADLLATERARYTAESPPRIADEIQRAAEEVEAERTAGTGGVAAGEVQPGGSGLPEVDRSGGEAGAQSGGGVVGGGRSENGPGGNAATPESVELRGGERGGPAAPNSTRDQPLAPKPATVFGPKESPFLDKAGNIRVENLTTSEDVAHAIHDAADANNDFIGDRRGVVTDGQIADLANDLGMSGAEDLVRKRVVGQSFNAEQVWALRKLLIQSATDVSAAMKQAAIGTDEDLMAYAIAKDRHQMIQATVAQATAEAGRALRAFRTMSGEEGARATDEFIKGATGRTLFQLRMEAKLGANLDTPAKVSKFLNDARERSFGGMVLEYWINGLISGVATHVTYMQGNLILALEKAVPETALAAAIGAARRGMGRPGEVVHIGEVGAQLRGALRGLPGAAESFLEAMRTGQTTLLPGETAKPLMPFQGDTSLAIAKSMTNDAVTWRQVGSQAFGMMRGIRDGFVAGAALLKAGGIEGAPLLGAQYSTLGQIPDIAVRGVPVVPLGSAIRVPGRSVAAIHSFFRSLNYSMDKAADAYRTASEEGLKGEAFAARVGDIWQNPTPEKMESYRQGATERTLMGQGGEFVKSLSKLTNATLDLPVIGKIAPLKFIDPFVHIGANIIKQSVVERTPLGILSSEIRADLLGKNGNIAQDMAQARMLAGTSIALFLGGLAMEGYASGSGPADPHQSAMWRLAGNQPHSVRIGDIWYQVNRLGPMGMLMGTAADMYDVAHEATSGDLLTAGAHLQHALTQNILDESFMRGPADLIKAIEDPGRYGEAYIKNFLSSFVPFSVGMAQMARASDPYSRQARTVMDSIKAKIPGLSESLLPRRDIWGEEMPSYDAFGHAGVTAIYETRMSHDPVNAAMLNLGIYPAQPIRKIRNVELNDDQYDDYSRIAGRMTKMRLDAIVKSPDWNTWPNHIRHDVISEVIRQSREAAQGVVMMKYPQIVRDATAAKMKKLED